MKRKGLAKNRLLVGIFGLLIVASFLTTARAQQAPGKPSPTPPGVIELLLNTFFPPTHTQVTQILQPWMQEAERRTGGRVKIVPYYGGALSKMEENYSSVITGRADIGNTYMYLPAGKFPIMDLIGNFVTTEPKTDNYSVILNELYKEFPSIQEEMKETKVLSLYVTAPDLLIGKKPLKTLENLKGLKIMTSGAIASMKVAALGASPVTMTSGEAYMAMERGVLDGGNLNIGPIIDRKYADIAKHLLINVQLGRAPFYLVMNWQTWNKLPKDIQRIFDELNLELIKKWDNKFRNERLTYTRRFVDEFRGTTYEWSQEDVAKATKLWKSAEDKSVADLEAKGYPARKILDRFRDLESRM